MTIERLVVESLPSTILRATQFHTLFEELFTAERFLPVYVAPKFTVQPIAVEDVAVRLTEIAGSGPAGRVPDIGGPEQRSIEDLARAWKRALGRRRPVLPLRLPGRTFAVYAAGHNLVPGPPYGTITFEEHLAKRFGS